MIKTQAAFSKHIKSQYKECLITNDVTYLEAVNIVSKTFCDKVNNKYLKYHKYNGILLKNDINKLFNNYVWCLDPFNISFNEDETINIGIIYDMNIDVPLSLKCKESVKINQNSYVLVYIRYVEFCYKYVEKYKTKLDKDSYNDVKELYELVSRQLKFSHKIDEKGHVYEQDNDAIMIDTMDLSKKLEKTVKVI